MKRPLRQKKRRPSVVVAGVICILCILLPSNNVLKSRLSLVPATTMVNKAAARHQSEKLVVCTRVNNEAPYLREWIEYHRMIGFEKFILLNDKSTDDTQCVLDAYAEEGIVLRVPEEIDDVRYGRQEAFDNLNSRVDRVFDVCARYLAEQDDATRTWMVTHDVDEYIWFQKESQEDTLHVALRRLIQSNGDSVKSIRIPRLIVGSSGHEHYNKKLVMDRFTQRYDPSGCKRDNNVIRKPRTKPLQHPLLSSGAHSQMSWWSSNRYEKNTADDFVRGKRRRLFTKENPRSYCQYHRGNKFDPPKAMSLVSSLALTCHTPDKETGELKPDSCNHDGHRHKLVGGKKFIQQVNSAGTIEIMHYMTKSREEFLSRVCSSVWQDKYSQCQNCSPESYFNLTESYANNFNDTRMAPFSAKLKIVMSESSIGDNCDTRYKTHSPEYYRMRFEGRKKL